MNWRFYVILEPPPAKRRAACQAIQWLRGHRDFRALIEIPYPSNLVEQAANEIRLRELLPTSEVHDSLILAESCFLGCGLLVTSDHHLLEIDHEMLTLVLVPFDLAAPVIASPREIVGKFFR